MRKITLDVLTSEGCINCLDFFSYWEEISSEWQCVQLRELSVSTSEGMLMAQSHRIMQLPGLIIDDQFFSSGKVDKEKFVNKLKVVICE